MSPLCGDFTTGGSVRSKKRRALSERKGYQINILTYYLISPVPHSVKKLCLGKSIRVPQLCIINPMQL